MPEASPTIANPASMEKVDPLGARAVIVVELAAGQTIVRAAEQVP